jgi:hypothetical protein
MTPEQANQIIKILSLLPRELPEECEPPKQFNGSLTEYLAKTNKSEEQENDKSHKG